MTITIAPFKIDPSHNYPAQSVKNEREKHSKGYGLPITYWGIYLDDKHVSYTSSKELAEKTKQWIEKWLKDRL
jgi:hypothetical protein